MAERRAKRPATTRTSRTDERQRLTVADNARRRRGAVPELSFPERMVLRKLRLGMSAAEIAMSMNCMKATADRHIRSIYQKFGAKDREDLVDEPEDLTS